MTSKVDREENNFAYIDGQNLYLGTTNADNPWDIDLARFRVYLSQKYSVKEAYYYIGNKQAEFESLYKEIENAGFILVFKPHTNVMLSQKKGNVDIDIVFDVMKKLYYEK